MSFGRFGQWPFRLGGGKGPRELVHDSLLEQYSKVLDVSGDQLTDSEVYAEAALLSLVWVAGKRASLQGLPLATVDWIEAFEAILKITPLPNDTEPERRNAISARFVSLLGNSELDIREACSRLLGLSLNDVKYLTDAQATTYLPGLNPGPPGLEWFSQRAIVFVLVNKNGLTSLQYSLKIAKLENMLENLLPAWMSFSVARQDHVGVGTGFFLDLSLLDEVGL